MSKRLLSLFLVQFILVGCSTNAQHSLNMSPRYDGVYRVKTETDEAQDKQLNDTAEEEEQYCEYLRFYPSGVVITVTSVCSEDASELQDIKKWFSEENAGPGFSGISKGLTSITGKKIKFDATSKEGITSYEGNMANKHIKLSSYSHINQYRDHNTFKFVKW